MNRNKGVITVFYDGSCPKCVKDRCNYEKLAGRAGENINWFDITGQDERLREIGIDPQKALKELHVKNENQQILAEIDAYILILSSDYQFKSLPGINLHQYDWVQCVSA